MPNYGVPILGFVVGVSELCLASVYNFHDFGCAMGIFCLLMSLAAIVLLRTYNREEAVRLRLKKKKELALQQKGLRRVMTRKDLINPDDEDDFEDDFGVEVKREHDDQLDDIRKQVDQSKSIFSTYIVVFIVYCTIMLTVMAMAIIRILALSMRFRWREPYENESFNFPTSCGTWTTIDGCTRVSIYDDGCEEEGQIPSIAQNVFYVKALEDEDYDGYWHKFERLNHNIDVCVGELEGIRYMGDTSVDELFEQSEGMTLHYTINSFVWGFIYDIYLMYEPYTNSYDPSSSNFFAVTIQS